MKLSEINDTWEVDSSIDPLDIASASIQTAKLHSKYLKILSNTRLQLTKNESEYELLRSTKRKYYRGEMTREELREHGWDQFQKILKKEVEEYVASDEAVLRQGEKVSYLRTVISTLESILKVIMNRSFEIKNYIEWIKYTQGEL